jgi:small subunit ribosomal protein S17
MGPGKKEIQEHMKMVAKKETKVKKNKDSKSTCNDKKCGIHGSVALRGRTFKGKVVSARMQNTVNVEWDRSFYLTKYERFEVRRSRVKAHNPPCINAKEGDEVLIAETRPLSKTVKFMVVKKK